MATYTININERTTFGKQLLLFLKGLGIIVETPKKGVSQFETKQDIRSMAIFLFKACILF